MNQRILIPGAICAVVVTLLSGCGSSLISRVDREDSGIGFAQHVLKLSEARKLIVNREFFQDRQVATLTTVGSRRIQETKTKVGFVFLQIGNVLYFARPGQACYTERRVAGSYVEDAFLPAGAAVRTQIERVVHGRIYFVSDLRLGRGRIVRGFERGSLSFNKDDLIAARATDLGPHSGSSIISSYSYPKQIPSDVITTAPTNLCNA
jgi:hypothetical protein